MLSKFYPQASSSSDTVDPELPDLAARDDAVGVDPAEAARLVVVHRHHRHVQHHMDWTDVMIGFSPHFSSPLLFLFLLTLNSSPVLFIQLSSSPFLSAIVCSFGLKK